MTSAASIFSGGKLADIGLLAAGYTPIWGVESDEAIANVADVNVPAHTIRQRAEMVRWSALERPDLLWVSPECREFSRAKTQGREGTEQLGQAHAICEAIRTLTPRTFVLENVIGYARSQSLLRIRTTLDALGYWSVVERINAANFGVPQTRRRLILRAVRGGLVPHLPGPVKWRGWYDAIADLIPTLPEARFAPWQLARLPANLGGLGYLVGGGNTQLTQVDSKARETSQPAFTISAGNGATSNTRAFIVHPTEQRTMPVRDRADPIWTIMAGANHTRQPANRPCAWLAEGHVVAMTPRALARFQSIPDWYQLPDRIGLATRIIGNAVPPLLAQRIGESLRGVAP